MCRLWFPSNELQDFYRSYHPSLQSTCPKVLRANANSLGKPSCGGRKSVGWMFWVRRFHGEKSCQKFNYKKNRSCLTVKRMVVKHPVVQEISTYICNIPRVRPPNITKNSSRKDAYTTSISSTETFPVSWKGYLWVTPKKLDGTNFVLGGGGFQWPNLKSN